MFKNHLLTYFAGCLLICIQISCQNQTSTGNKNPINNSSENRNSSDSVALISGVCQVNSEKTHMVSVPAPGRIEKIYVSVGDSVVKNQRLLQLSSLQFIQLQQEFLECKSQLEYFREDYKRQGELTVEDVASIKKMQKAKAEYWQVETRYKSLEKQLNYIGIPTKNLSENNIRTSIYIYAPVHGIVYKNLASPGKYVDPEDLLFAIINQKDIILEFSVPSESISKIHVGDTFYYRLVNLPEISYKAAISRIGVEISNNQIKLMANSIGRHSNLRPGENVVSNDLLK